MSSKFFNRGSINQGFIVPNDPLDRFATPANEQLDMGLGVRPSSEIAPTDRPLNGARLNNRGHAVIVELDPTAPLYEQPIVIVESPRQNGDDAENILVTLGMDVQGPDEDVDRTDVTAVALVEWGVGGASFNAEIDWIQGLVFSVPASFVRITARVSATNPAIGGSPVSVALSASLSYGCTRGPGTPVRRTILVGDIGPLGAVTADFRIPKWATSFTVSNFRAVDLAPQPNLQIELQSSSLNTNIAYWQWVNRTNCANQWELTFPIPNGARSFRVRNNDPFLTADDVRVIWNLGLP